MLTLRIGWNIRICMEIFQRSGLVLNKDKLTPLKSLFSCIVWIVWADLGKLSSVLVQLLGPLRNLFQDMSVSNANQTNPWKQNALNAPITPKFYRHVTEVKRNCVHHLYKTIQTPTVLNTSRKIYIRERKLTNKLTIKKNFYLNGA